MAKTPQEYNIIERDGEQLKVFADGTVYNLTKRQLERGPFDNPITRDPKGMILRRNEISRQIAREAIDEGAGIDRSRWGTGEGWRAVIRHTVETYMKSNNIRGMGEVFSKIGSAAGYLTNEPEEGGEGEAQSLYRELLMDIVSIAKTAVEEHPTVHYIEGKEV